MAQKITGLRVVLASPSDVKREREAFAKVVDQVNNDTARPAGFHLDLWRWETDARPGFNPKGPQGLIDKVLQIDQCDLLEPQHRAAHDPGAPRAVTIMPNPPPFANLIVLPAANLTGHRPYK